MFCVPHLNDTDIMVESILFFGLNCLFYLFNNNKGSVPCLVCHDSAKEQWNDDDVGDVIIP